MENRKEGLSFLFQDLLRSREFGFQFLEGRHLFRRCFSFILTLWVLSCRPFHFTLHIVRRLDDLIRIIELDVWKITDPVISTGKKYPVPFQKQGLSLPLPIRTSVGLKVIRRMAGFTQEHTKSGEKVNQNFRELIICVEGQEFCKDGKV